MENIREMLNRVAADQSYLQEPVAHAWDRAKYALNLVIGDYFHAGDPDWVCEMCGGSTGYEDDHNSSNCSVAAAQEALAEMESIVVY